MNITSELAAARRRDSSHINKRRPKLILRSVGIILDSTKGRVSIPATRFVPRYPFYK